MPKPGAFPQRIVCLTEEPTEILYALGLQDRIVGISGFTVRPPCARKEKPKVSAFTEAKIDKILGLKPDLVIGFSDLQADIAQALIKAGLEVWISNHRSVQAILAYIQRLGGMVGEAAEAQAYVRRLQDQMIVVERYGKSLLARPKVYFEEWDEPLIASIRWVSELIEIAGGIDIFPEFRDKALGKDRIIADPDEVVRRAPDLIIGSWCGKKFRPDQVRKRPGWSAIPAIRDGQIHEIDASIILQPGPAALSDGLMALHQLVNNWAVANR